MEGWTASTMSSIANSSAIVSRPDVYDKLVRRGQDLNLGNEVWRWHFYSALDQKHECLGNLFFNMDNK